MEVNKIIQGDTLEVLKTMPEESIDCITTSPPYYGLRDYGVSGQIGLEKTLKEYLDKMLLVTTECKRALKKTGTMWINHGDSYASNGKLGGDFGQDGKISKGFSGRGRTKDYPEKSLMLQAHRLAIRMVDEQKWILRNIIIWHKPNCMPSSVKDRFTVDYEPVFFFSKSKKYWFEPQFESFVPNSDMEYRKTLRIGRKYEVKQPYINNNPLTYSKNLEVNPLGRNKRSVWKIPTHPFSEAHFATFPEKLIEPMILAGCPQFICSKCGKAREKIYKMVNSEIQRPRKFGKTGNNDRNDTGDIYVEKEPHFEGYTDCGCNAEFTNGIVLDPFMGAGTTAVVAKKLGRNFVGIELNPEYVKMAEKRISRTTSPLF